MSSWSMQRDMFGNTQLFIDPAQASTDVSRLVQLYNTNPNCALIFYGLQDSVVQQYNATLVEVNKLTMQSRIHYRGIATLALDSYPNRASCYVIYNLSTCPKTFYGHVFRASACIIVKHKEQSYFITVKDRFKQFRVLPGGTAELDEVAADGTIDFHAISIRSVLETTSIKLDHASMRQMAVEEFSSTYLNVTEIPDLAQIMCVQATSQELGIEHWFTASNQSGINYIVKPEIIHAEIEHICLDHVFYCNDAKQPDLSFIAWACAQAAVANVRHSKTYPPSSLKNKLRIRYEPSPIMSSQQALTFHGMQKFAQSLKAANFIVDKSDTPICWLLSSGQEQKAIEFMEQQWNARMERDVAGCGPLHYAIANNCNRFMNRFWAKLDCHMVSVHQLRPIHIAILCLNDDAITRLFPSSKAVTIDVRQEAREETFGACTTAEFVEMCAKTLPECDNCEEMGRKCNNCEAVLYSDPTNPFEEIQYNDVIKFIETKEEKDWSNLELNFKIADFVGKKIDINYLVWVVATAQERNEIFKSVLEGCRSIYLAGGDRLKVEICNAVTFDHDRVLQACDLYLNPNFCSNKFKVLKFDAGKLLRAKKKQFTMKKNFFFFLVKGEKKKHRQQPFRTRICSNFSREKRD